MPYILIGAPIVGILTALAAVVAEQLLAVAVNIFFHKEIILDVYAHLGFFVISAAIIEEAFKYFSLSYIFRQIFDLRRFKFIFAALFSGLFFGLTEAYLILLTNGKKISEIGTLGGDTLLALFSVILVHILTIFLIAVLIAAGGKEKRFRALRIIVPPTLVHLLYNFIIIQKGNFTNWLVVLVLGIVFLAGLVILVFNLRDLD
jgi:hypothetical protein